MKPDCPKCGGNETYQVTGLGDPRWRCQQCDAEFEPDDEGGDYCTDPTRRLQREEDRAQRERVRRNQKIIRADRDKFQQLRRRPR